MAKLNKNKWLKRFHLSKAVLAGVCVMHCEAVEAKYILIRDAMNYFNNVSWRILANNKIVDAEKDNWIKQGQYRDSIIKVIGEAIGNCVTEQAEFSKKEQKDVITFAASPKDTTYSPENWNAVVLYNYLNELKFHFIDDKDKRTENQIFGDVAKKINAHYAKEYKISGLDVSIRKAISDIKEYSKELELYNEMKEFVTKRNTKYTYEELMDEDQAVTNVSPILRLSSTTYDDSEETMKSVIAAGVEYYKKAIQEGQQTLLSTEKNILGQEPSKIIDDALETVEQAINAGAQEFIKSLETQIEMITKSTGEWIRSRVQEEIQKYIESIKKTLKEKSVYLQGIVQDAISSSEDKRALQIAAINNYLYTDFELILVTVCTEIMSELCTYTSAVMTRDSNGKWHPLHIEDDDMKYKINYYSFRIGPKNINNRICLEDPTEYEGHTETTYECGWETTTEYPPRKLDGKDREAILAKGQKIFE